jgi:hypothetical protein
MNFVATPHRPFSPTIWEVDCASILEPEAVQLRADALRAIEEDPAEGHPFRQSMHRLFERSDRWRRAAESIESIAQTLVDQYSPGRRLQLVRMWSLMVPSAAEWDREAAAQRLFHHHGPTDLSFVVYLDPPAAGETPAGTAFANPLPMLPSVPDNPHHIIISGEQFRLVIFPGWLEHGPTRPSTAVGAADRLTVAGDLAFQT